MVLLKNLQNVAYRSVLLIRRFIKNEPISATAGLKGCANSEHNLVNPALFSQRYKSNLFFSKEEKAFVIFPTQYHIIFKCIFYLIYRQSLVPSPGGSSILNSQMFIETWFCKLTVWETIYIQRYCCCCVLVFNGTESIRRVYWAIFIYMYWIAAVHSCICTTSHTFSDQKAQIYMVI